MRLLPIVVQSRGECEGEKHAELSEGEGKHMKVVWAGVEDAGWRRNNLRR